MKVKIIEDQLIDSLQDKINTAIKDMNVINISVTSNSCHDLYHGRAPEVCNNWTNYTAIIAYESKNI